MVHSSFQIWLDACNERLFQIPQGNDAAPYYGDILRMLYIQLLNGQFTKI